MRNLAWFLAGGLGATVIGACSLANAPDDAVPGPGGTGGTGTGTGTGGQGGGTTSSTTTTSSTSSSSSASTGGGGTGGAPLRETGEPCETAASCEGNFCITEVEFGFPKGTCSAPCTFVDPNNPDAGGGGEVACNPGETCIDASGLTPEGGLCLPICDLADPMCRLGYQCLAAQPPYIPDPICQPFCTDASQCASGKCGADGRCEAVEICDDSIDNDSDGLIDCYDPDCACPSACPGAVFMGNGAVFSGDTSAPGTPNSSRGSCTGPYAEDQLNGGTGFTPEMAFYFIAPLDGTLHIELDSSDTADLGLYVRTICDDQGTEIQCADPVGPGGVDIIDLAVVGGSTYFIFVDGYTSLNASSGPFTLYTIMQ